MTRFSVRAAAAIVSAILMAGADGSAALAAKQASIIVESTPAPKATVTTSEITIDIHFTSKIDRHYSRLMLMLPNGRQVDLASISSVAPDHLSARASSLTPGDYTLRWEALPVGKKLVKGEIPFTVK